MRAIIIAVALSVALPASAITITYDFDDGTNQGWVNVLVSPGDPPTGYEASNRTDALAPALSGSYRVLPQIPGPFSPTEDSHHDTLVFRSPQFVLGPSGSISFYLSVGTGFAAAPAASFASLPLSSSFAGFEGIGLRRASDGAYVLSARRSTNNAFAWDNFVFSNASLASNSLLGVPLTLDVIDYFEGGYGWVALDNVTINDWVAVPEPSTALLLGGGLAALLAIRRAARA